MLDCLGMNRLITHGATPTMINAMMRFIKGIFCAPSNLSCQIPGYRVTDAMTFRLFKTAHTLVSMDQAQEWSILNRHSDTSRLR
jgi:hypothetical protein